MSAGSSPSPQPFRVVIVGGGVAGIEAGLALRDLAGDRVDLRLLSPSREFVYRPLTVREPFGFARARRYPTAAVAADLGAEWIEDSLAAVDPVARTVQCRTEPPIDFDAVLLVLGAQARPRYAHATTIDDRHLDELLHGVIQDVEAGYVNRLGFLIPARMAWPLPIYELALTISTRAYDSNVDMAFTIVTPEDTPLAIFGMEGSRAVAELLAERNIEVITSAYAEVPDSRTVEISPGERRLEFDRVIALPELEGPAVPGLPEAPDGFIPVDDHGQVRGLERVYAAGDATDFPVKHGGIAAQQADTAAAAIAALAGAPVEPQAFRPMVQGMLLTGERPVYLSAHLEGGHGSSSEVSREPPAQPPRKISAKYLSPYLDERELGERAS
ncbi:MAG: hypothetical protein JOZ64_03805 [Solirubrobacterales bacterium]|nr:hypothetical protein [Solirubrobacterales bacterium]